MFAGAKENTNKHKGKWRKGRNVNKWENLIQQEHENEMKNIYSFMLSKCLDVKEKPRMGFIRETQNKSLNSSEKEKYLNFTAEFHSYSLY